MKYKILFVDYDYTITNSKDKVTKRTRKAIEDYVAAGGHFVITTSRPYWMIEDHAKNLGLMGDLICSQGASIINVQTGKYLYKSVINSDDLDEIVDYTMNKAYYSIVASNEELVTDRTTPLFLHIAKKIGFVFRNKNKATYREEIHSIEPFQVLCRTNSHLGNLMFAKKIKSHFKDKYGVHICSNHLTAITNKDASKGKALKIYSKMLGVPLSETAAFGDSIGDVSMYEYAGLSVAMGNAHKKLKEKADLVIGHTDKEGLAKFIESLI